jgi:maleamate amidohydrolase
VYVKDVHISSDRELVYVHQHCIKNPDEVPLHHKLAVHDSNATIVNKNTYSAFFGNDFADKLRALACETVLFTGTQTHVCVKYSALHAMMHGFRPVVLADSTVSSTDERHRMGLDEIARYIGEVSHSAYIINAISEAQE